MNDKDNRLVKRVSRKEVSTLPVRRRVQEGVIIPPPHTTHIIPTPGPSRPNWMGDEGDDREDEEEEEEEENDDDEVEIDDVAEPDDEIEEDDDDLEEEEPEDDED
jgi:hypothetical protein